MELIAEGTSWLSLLENQQQLDDLLTPQRGAQLVLEGPFALPDVALDAIYNGGKYAGIYWTQYPYMSGNKLVLSFMKNSPAIVAVLGAIGSFAFALAGAFFIGVISWQLLQAPGEAVVSTMQMVLMGGLLLGALYMVSK